MTLLARYDEACRALSEASAVDEVKDVRDRADALRLYARQARNKRLEIDAAEIRFRAERRIGELIARQREAGALAVGGRPARGKTGSALDPVSATLAEAGIDKHLADRARRYAAFSRDAFDAILARRRGLIEAEGKRVTVDLGLELSAVEKAAHRAAREAALADRVTALPDRRFGVILDDPEWRFEVHSRETGLDRAADNHYPTSSFDDILRRDIASIAAPDCAWFRWVTVPHLANGLRSIETNGFVYKTSWVWAKDRIGTGFWNRNRHEILLLAVRGQVPCPSPGSQWDSLLEAAVTEHSAKPDCFLAMIEAYFPNVPKIELNRRGPARPGWSAWGNEAELAGEVAA